MRAVVYHEYGSPDVLRVADIEEPAIADDEVLVRVHASSVNSWDWDLLRGTPLVNRVGGLRRPRYPVLGADVAGRVEAAGPAVRRLRPGDAVFADVSHSGWGGFAEYVAVPERVLAAKPPGLGFEEAASLPQAGGLALQGLRGRRPVRPGDHVLVNGAGGGVGTLAVQLAKVSGAEVTGVDRADKLDLVRALGADHTIDYRAGDVGTMGQTYDVVLDVVADRSLAGCRHLLRPGGAYVVVGGRSSSVAAAMLLGPIVSLVGDRRVGVLVHRPDPADLAVLGGLVTDGTIRPVIDRCFPLDQVPAAMRYFASGAATGKVVITV